MLRFKIIQNDKWMKFYRKETKRFKYSKYVFSLIIDRKKVYSIMELIIEF